MFCCTVCCTCRTAGVTCRQFKHAPVSGYAQGGKTSSRRSLYLCGPFYREDALGTEAFSSPASRNSSRNGCVTHRQLMRQCTLIDPLAWPNKPWSPFPHSMRRLIKPSAQLSNHCLFHKPTSSHNALSYGAKPPCHSALKPRNPFEDTRSASSQALVTVRRCALP